MTDIRPSAYAKSENIIELVVDKNFYLTNDKLFSLYENGMFLSKLKLVSTNETETHKTFTFMNSCHLTVGKDYEIKTKENYFIPVDISYKAKEDWFEKKYRYDGELGAIYSKERTTFRVFSPFATYMRLNVCREGGEWIPYAMKKDEDTGIFEVTLEGDYDKARYIYAARIFEQVYDIIDPYAYALTSNSRLGYVIDPEKVKAIATNRECLKEIKSQRECLVYECSVRDMTSLTNLEHKGTYNALAKKGIKTKKGNPVGLDYIASLGVSHVQLLPVLDFASTDEDNPKDSYNWGYDPTSFFAPEGSYSSNPDDPYARIIELRNLVAAFHQKGIRVNLDVVYNHVFSYQYNALHVLVPSYFERFNNDGSLSSGTGCGNDFESRHYMARKVIIDSLLHLIDFYDVDGFRFDLMGILDCDTMNKAVEEVRKVRPDAMIYGEGWDLPTNLPGNHKASYYNAYKMPEVGFFNDRFRDVVKGKTNAADSKVRGYLSGDSSYLDGFKHVMLGSTIALAFNPMFSSSKQSINYVECHDNMTLFDKLKACCPDDTNAEIIKRINMINVAVLTADGIPFVHAGQEIGLSKGGLDNTYNSGDRLNGFDYNVLDSRKDMYHFFKDAVYTRDRIFTLADGNLKSLKESMTFENLPYNAVKINYHLDEFDLYIIFNPTKNSFTYSFANYVSILFNETGNVEKQDFYTRLAIINALSVYVFMSRKGEKTK